MVESDPTSSGQSRPDASAPSATAAKRSHPRGKVAPRFAFGGPPKVPSAAGASAASAEQQHNVSADVDDLPASAGCDVSSASVTNGRAESGASGHMENHQTVAGAGASVPPAKQPAAARETALSAVSANAASESAESAGSMASPAQQSAAAIRNVVHLETGPGSSTHATEPTQAITPAMKSAAVGTAVADAASVPKSPSSDGLPAAVVPPVTAVSGKRSHPRGRIAPKIGAVGAAAAGLKAAGSPLTAGTTPTGAPGTAEGSSTSQLDSAPVESAAEPALASTAVVNSSVLKDREETATTSASAGSGSGRDDVEIRTVRNQSQKVFTIAQKSAARATQRQTGEAGVVSKGSAANVNATGTSSAPGPVGSASGAGDVSEAGAREELPLPQLRPEPPAKARAKGSTSKGRSGTVRDATDSAPPPPPDLGERVGKRALSLTEAERGRAKGAQERVRARATAGGADPDEAATPPPPAPENVPGGAAGAKKGKKSQASSRAAAASGAAAATGVEALAAAVAAVAAEGGARGRGTGADGAEPARGGSKAKALERKRGGGAGKRKTRAGVGGAADESAGRAGSREGEEGEEGDIPRTNADGAVARKRPRKGSQGAREAVAAAAESKGGAPPAPSPTAGGVKNDKGRARGKHVAAAEGEGTRVLGPAVGSVDSERRTIKELLSDKTFGEPMSLEAQASAARAKKGARDNAAAVASRAREAELTSAPAADDGTVLAPQPRIIGGRITIDDSSLTISNNPNFNGAITDVVLDQSGRGANAWSKKRKHCDRWTDEETDEFYLGLQKFGTDFEVIAAWMGDRRNDRRHVRNKFKKEEKMNHARINAAISNRVPPTEGDWTRVHAGPSGGAGMAVDGAVPALAHAAAAGVDAAAPALGQAREPARGAGGGRGVGGTGERQRGVGVTGGERGQGGAEAGKAVEEDAEEDDADDADADADAEQGEHDESSDDEY